MYKLLLCWRYLRTRFLALACVISVTLGVATLIVVNSVMSGFSEKLRDRLHGLLADVVIESEGIEGFRDPKGKMAKIMADPFLAAQIDAMSASLEGFAMLQFTYPNGEVLTRPVRLMGVDAETRSELGGFKGYLLDPLKRGKSDFSLPEDLERRWRDREMMDLEFQRQKQTVGQLPEVPPAKGNGPVDLAKLPPPLPPVANQDNQGQPLPAPPPPIDPINIKIPRGAIVGNLVAGFRYTDPQTKKTDMRYVLHPGDSMVLITVKGPKLEPAYDRFVAVDYFQSDMSEYDSNLVFVDLKYLQELRSMDDSVTNIQIKLKDYREAKEVLAHLKAIFPMGFRVQTWESKQGPLLEAIKIEKGILNVLLFLIIAVAGFGILAIFSMIVTEKTRDIGIMKSLGASNLGVLQIFLTYGLLLGIVGSTLGTVLGLTLTINLNEVEEFISRITGNHVFNPEIYYFKEIPTNIETSMLVLVNIGAILIAVIFSILPALRASMLHPVRALRFE